MYKHSIEPAFISICGDRTDARQQPEILAAPNSERRRFALCRKGSCCPVLEVAENPAGETGFFVVEDGTEIEYLPEEMLSLCQEFDSSPCDYFYLSSGSGPGITLSREHAEAIKEAISSYLEPGEGNADR